MPFLTSPSHYNLFVIVSITDLARHKSDDPTAVIGNWMRNRNTIEFLGIWESLYNLDFKPLEFEGFREEAGRIYHWQ